MPHIFISYRREDTAYIAGNIYERLCEAFGNDSVFFDIDAIPLGVDFRDHIGNAVGQCDVLLAIIGDRWSTAVNGGESSRLNDPTDFVRIEIESAIERGIPVIPVLVGQANIPVESDLPDSLRTLRFRNAAEVRAGKDLPHHLERLVHGVQDACRLNAQRSADNESRQIQKTRRDDEPTHTLDVDKPSARHIRWTRSLFTLIVKNKRWSLPLIVLFVFCFLGIIGGGAISIVFFWEDPAIVGLVAIPTCLVGIAIAVYLWIRLKDA